MRFRVEAALIRVKQPQAHEKNSKGGAVKADYQHSTWITRPRPGIDRVSSAWLITRFIDSEPQFVFGGDPAAHAEAVPFDMFQGAGFGHEEDRCTFETLCLAFDVTTEEFCILVRRFTTRILRTEGSADPKETR